jgi:hypothetical protein
MEFRPQFDEGRGINPNTQPFEKLHIPVHFVGANKDFVGTKKE